MISLLAPCTSNNSVGGPKDTAAPSDSLDTAEIDTNDSPPDDTEDTGETGEPPGLEVVWTASPVISSAGTVTWTTDEPMTAWVELGPDESYGRSRRVAMTPSTDHTIVVVGIPADTTYHWRAASASEDGATTLYGADATVTAGPAGDYLPPLDVTVSTEERSDGYIRSAILNLDDVTSLVVLDGDGVPVWWWESESNDIRNWVDPSDGVEKQVAGCGPGAHGRHAVRRPARRHLHRGPAHWRALDVRQPDHDPVRAAGVVRAGLRQPHLRAVLVV